MCGIWGSVTFSESKKFSAEEHHKMHQSALPVRVRGPECTRTIETSKMHLEFHRLAIRGVSFMNDQPFCYSTGDTEYVVMCNGEIYNCEYLSDTYLDGARFDCDISYIFPLWQKLDYSFRRLNEVLRGEFALSIIELDNTGVPTSIFISTDKHSVRPIFTHWNPETKTLSWSSILAGLKDLNDVRRLAGSHLQLITKYGISESNYTAISCTEINTDNLAAIITEAVNIRMISDRPLGALLSGGLDSSLVCALAAKYLVAMGLPKLRTFAAGMIGSPDLAKAKIVAEYIGSEHTEIIFTAEEALALIPECIHVIESFDITSVRASTCQYLASAWISLNTDIKVLLVGDGSDELFCGYKYFLGAPSLEECIAERDRLLDEIHLFDGLRTDRTIASWGLEARVPFLDPIVTCVVQNPMFDHWLYKPSQGIEKLILRSAFAGTNLLPDEILWRSKVAFSDGVSVMEKSWYQIIQEWCLTYDNQMTKAFNELSMETFDVCPPTSLESFIYRMIYRGYFGSKNEKIIDHFWMPRWAPGVTDPSARLLTGYTES